MWVGVKLSISILQHECVIKLILLDLDFVRFRLTFIVEMSIMVLQSRNSINSVVIR